MENTLTLTYKYEIRDEMGRLWDRTLTRGMAHKRAQRLAQTKGLKMLVCEIRENQV